MTDHTTFASADYKTAAAYIGCSVSLLRRLIAEGHIETFKLKGTDKPVISRADLDAYVAESRDQ